MSSSLCPFTIFSAQWYPTSLPGAHQVPGLCAQKHLGPRPHSRTRMSRLLSLCCARSASPCGCECVYVFFVPITCWEQGRNTTSPTPHSSCGASAPGCMGTGRRGRAGEGVGRAPGGDEVKVIDAAQPAVEEAGDASVSPGAGRGVNERRRHAHSAPSAHPGMAAAQGPAAPSSPEQVSHLRGGRAPSLVPGRLGGRTGGGERG